MDLEKSGNYLSHFFFEAFPYNFYEKIFMNYQSGTIFSSIDLFDLVNQELTSTRP